MSYSDGNSYEEILSRCLSNERLTNIDKRVGSIIYDALAPLCLELAEAYIKMDIMDEQTRLLTATGTNLDNKVYDYGVSREEATYALKYGSFKKYQVDDNGDYVLDGQGNKILIDMEIPLGSRFSVPNNHSITYQYIEHRELDGNGQWVITNLLQCEQSGTGGNEHVGTILPLTPIMDLVKAEITSTHTPGQDVETDDELRTRTLNYINNVAFGGNIEDYIEKVQAIDGVGNVKVYPAWQYDETNDHNGSVLLSIVDASYNPIDATTIANIKNIIDPETYTGQGYGIAPIGHYVTITTPVEANVNVTMMVTKNDEVEEGETRTKILEVLDEYIDSKRRLFSQESVIQIYRSEIITAIMSNLSPDYVIDVSQIRLNNADSDIIYTDEGLIGGQSIPKVGTILVEFEGI